MEKMNSAIIKLPENRMKQLLFFLIGVLLSTATSAQQKQVEKPIFAISSPAKLLLQYNADIPLGVNGEQYASGIADIPIMKDVAVRLERFYTKFGDQEQFSTGLAMKYFLNENLYVISGTEIQFHINDNTGAPERELMRLSLGMGYRVNSDLLIELGYKPRIGSPNLDISESILSSRESTFFLKARF